MHKNYENNDNSVFRDPIDKKTEYNIYIVLPAYNESKVIGNVIEELKVRNLNIIIIDDGFSDETYKVAEKSLKNFNGFIYRHSINRGVGAALKTGIEAALRKKMPI